MRLIVFFDLPTLTPTDRRNYRQFIKYLDSEGYVMIQFFVYSKVCINNDAASTATKRVMQESPTQGDVRYLVVTENQYQKIVNINQTYSIQEKITNDDRTIMIGGMNDED